MFEKLQTRVERFVESGNKEHLNDICKYVNKHFSFIYNRLDFGSKKFIKARLAYDEKDLKQECLLVLVDSLKKYSPSICPFYPFYIHNVRMRVKQLCAFCSAKKRRVVSIIPLEDTLEIAVEFKKDTLELMIEFMPEKYKNILQKSYVGFTLTEIAESIGKSRAYVHSTLQDGLEILRHEETIFKKK